MSNSGLSSLPATWCWSHVAELGKVVSGGTPSTKEPEYWGAAINWISPADLSGYKAKFIEKGAKSLSRKGLDNSSATLMPIGSILFSSRAPIGYVAIASAALSTNQGFKSLVPATSLNNEYLYYYLKSAKGLAEDRATGTTFKELSGKNFSLLPVPLPPANEQTRIVEKIEELFSELDKGVESLKMAQQQLKVYRQALLKQAFEGKLTEQWRADNPDKVESAEQLLARIKTEREARYQQQLEEWNQAVTDWECAGKEGKKPAKPKKPESINRIKPAEHTLPTTPDSWIWVNYGRLCELVRNGISKKPVGESGDKIFRISAVRPMFFDMEDYRYIQNFEGEYDAYYLKKGDILFTRYNGSRRYVGVGAEYKSNEKRLFPDKLIQTRIAISSVSPSFIEKAVNSGFSRKSLEKQIRTTAGQSGVSGGDIKNILVPLCSHEEQLALVALLDGQLSVVDSMEKDISSNLQKSEALRQSILKKAFSGQLVSQNPDDEPASELLARIRQEREDAERKAKEAKKTAPKRRRSPSKKSTSTKTDSLTPA